MIRRDYLLRQLEQFAAMLARIAGLAKGEQWQEASAVTGGELQRLTGVEPRALLGLSGSALLARLIEGEPSFAVEAKIIMLVTLMKTEGDLSAGQNRLDEAREFYLKGLHFLLETFPQVAVTERPDFIPTVETFLIALGDGPLPTMTNAMLMRHYEWVGEFGKAEDVLFDMLEAEPNQPELIELGRQFYQRLLGLSNADLAVGNLPREEVQAGLAELEGRVGRVL